ncbi:hypothetical protein DFH06DRAFT_1340756 [Mycena polygramma]|nr:hypothetical protein DFH06DRAFT_1340756 [Mycena polygramma]
MVNFCVNCGAVAPPSPTFQSPLGHPPPISSPVLARLLTTNDIPLDSDIPLVRNLIADSQEHIRSLNAHLRDLDAQIRDLQATLADWVQVRNDAAEHARQHQSILSPVRRLPSELVCEIFLLAWSTTPSKAEATLKEPPWYL